MSVDAGTQSNENTALSVSSVENNDDNVSSQSALSIMDNGESEISTTPLMPDVANDNDNFTTEEFKKESFSEQTAPAVEVPPSQDPLSYNISLSSNIKPNKSITPNSGGGDKKYDWFKNELAGNTNNFADVFQDGMTPDRFNLKDKNEYWGNEAIKNSFVQQFGDEKTAEKKFDEMYETSTARLKAYKEMEFDISATSNTRFLPTPYAKNLERLGGGQTYNITHAETTNKFVPDAILAEGRSLKYGMVTRPTNSMRESAENVFVDGDFMAIDEYEEKHNAALVYATNTDGSYKFEDGKTFLRPLKDGEVKQPYEEYYSSTGDYWGMNKLETTDSYLVKMIPKGFLNLTQTLLRGGNEVTKSAFEFFHGEDVDSKLYDSMINYENSLGKHLYMPSSDAASKSWTNPEALMDAIIQGVGQILVMKGVGVGTAALTGSAKAGSVAGKMVMAAMAAPGIKDSAKAAGLSNREAAGIHAMSLLMFYNIGALTDKWLNADEAVKKMVMDKSIKQGFGAASTLKQSGGKLSQAAQAQIAKNIVSNFKQIVKKGKWETTKKVVKAPFKIPGQIAKTADDIVEKTAISSRAMQSAGATVLEASEESLEAVAEHSIMWAYDNLYKSYVGNNTKVSEFMSSDHDNRFNTTWEQLGQDVLAGATIGGIVGGGSKFFMHNKAHDLAPSYYRYLATGEGAKMKSRLEELHAKGALGNKYINAQGNDVVKGEDSRNDIAYKAIKKDIETAEYVWNSHELNEAYSNTGKRLNFLSGSNASQKNLAKSSIGEDIVNNLNKIDNLNEVNADLAAKSEDPEVAEKIAKNEETIIKAQKEIKDIKDGKLAGKYYHEIMYNMFDKNLNFSNFYELNKKHSKDYQKIKSEKAKIEESKGKTLKTIKETDYISPEDAIVLRAKLEEDYKEVPDSDGEYSRPDGYEELFKAINKAEDNYNRVANVLGHEDLIKEFDTETFESGNYLGKTVDNFEEELKESLNTGESIFDNVEALEETISQIEVRQNQLFGIISSNEAANNGLVKLGESPNNPVLTEQEQIAAHTILEDLLNRTVSLKNTALDNRENFEISINKANNAFVVQKVKRLIKVQDLIAELDETLETEPLGVIIGDNLTAMSNTKSYQEKEQLIIKTEKAIFDYFSNDKTIVLDALYELHGFNTGDINAATRINLELGIAPNTGAPNKEGVEFNKNTAFVDDNQAVKKAMANRAYPSGLRYLKTILTQDTSVFHTRYKTVLDNTVDKKTDEFNYTHSRHIPSPMQRVIIQQAAAFLGDTATQPNVGMDGNFKSGLNITEGIFLASYQGTGKTIMASWTTKIDQMNRGGKALILANDKNNQINMENTMKGLDVSLAVNNKITPNNLLTYLNTQIQSEINTIVIDEATLINADLLMKLDLAVREINSSRTGAKLKILYTGDPMQIGATNTDGSQHNISNSGNLIMQTTDESRFSFRSGNDQINNLLESLRKKFDKKYDNTQFTGKYSTEVLSGTEIKEEAAFNEAVDRVMETLDDNSDFVIIAEETKHAAYKEKYKIKDNRILSPESAQGKQWEHVIIDIDTSVNNNGLVDTSVKKTMLSAVGRAKSYILMKVDNTPLNGISRKMGSVNDSTSNVSTTIDDDMRSRFKELESNMIKGLNFEEVTDNSDSGTSNEKVDISESTIETFIVDVKDSILTDTQKQKLNNILNKLDAHYNQFVNTPPNERYTLAFSYYTNGTVNGEPVKDVQQLLTLKKKLLYPETKEDMDIPVSFELRIHDGKGLESKVQTQRPKDSLPPVTENDKRMVIYATMEVEGEQFEIAVASILRPEKIGLQQSDLFDARIPFSESQSKFFRQNLQRFNEDSYEYESEDVILDRSLNLQQTVDNEPVSASKYIEDMSGFWNFATDIWYDTDDSKEKVAYLVYSPSLSTSEIDNLITQNPSLIDDKQSDIRKIIINGGDVTPVEEGLSLIKRFAIGNDVKFSELPKLSDGTEKKALAFFIDKMGYTYEDGAITGRNKIRNTKASDRKFNQKNRILAEALSASHYKSKNKGSGRESMPVETFYNRLHGATMKITTTDKKTKKRKTFGGAKVDTKLGYGYKYSTIYVIRSLYKVANSKSNNESGDAEIALKLIDEITTAIFPNGFYGQLKTPQGSTGGRTSDLMAPAIGANIDNFQVYGAKYPAMPTYSLSYDFFKDVLNNDGIFSQKITTGTRIKTEEAKKANLKPDTNANGTPVRRGTAKIDKYAMRLPKSTDGSNTNTEEIKTLAKGVESDGLDSLFGVFDKYFNFKPFNAYFPEFIDTFKRKIYQTIYDLEKTGNASPTVVTHAINDAIHQLKAELDKTNKGINEFIVENAKEGHGINRKYFLADTALRNTYFDYVMGREFKSLLKLKFSSIKYNENTDEYSFSDIRFYDNQMTDNKETVSHIARGSELVKMHLYNMPILKKNTNKTKKGDPDFIVTRNGDNRAIAELTKFVKDNDISSVEKAKAVMANSNLEHVQSFYHRFINPKPITVQHQDGTVLNHYSLNSKKLGNTPIAEDTITALLSFIATGKESQYAKMDFTENELQAAFSGVSSNRFRDNLELAIKSVKNNTPFKMISDNEVHITYPITNASGATKEHVWKLKKNNNSIVELKGNEKHVNIILSKLFNMPVVNWKQVPDVLNIAAENGRPLTFQMIMKTAQYLSQEKGSRTQEFMKGTDLIDWTPWADQYQTLKSIDSAFGYSNLNGDRVNLITVGAPLNNANHRIQKIRNKKEAATTPLALANNKFISGDMNIDGFYLKEGYQGEFSSKANGSMYESEQMAYNFKHLFLGSLKKSGSRLNNGKQSVMFHPLVYADKSSDYAVRVNRQFVLNNEDGTLNSEALESRLADTISTQSQATGLAALKLYSNIFGNDVAEEAGFSYNISTKDASNELYEKLINLNRYIDYIVTEGTPEQRAEINGLIERSDLTKTLHYSIDRDGNISGVNVKLLNNIKRGDILNNIRIGKRVFLNHYSENVLINKDLEITESDKNAISDLIENPTNEDVLNLFFYNSNEVAHEFSNLMIGPESQYRGMGDKTKRSPQISTQRQKFITRDSNYTSEFVDNETNNLHKGRKLNNHSKIATVADVSVPMEAINYQGPHNQDIYDGAAFHNPYARKMMKASYGNESGFNVGSTLKPISTHTNYETGAVRFDKYASFEITNELLNTDKGGQFIKHIDRLMKTSVPFSNNQITLKTGEIITANNLFELENAVKLINPESSPDDIIEETLDIMVMNGQQDNFLQEVIFDTSVKSGLSNLNRISDVATHQSLVYIERENIDRGLVLDTEHDPDEYDALLPTQIISSVMQGNFSDKYAGGLLEAISILGEAERGVHKTDSEDYYKSEVRDRINKQNSVGLVSKMVNKPDFSYNSKTIKNRLFSVIASDLSRRTISFKIKGGQQVVAPAIGVIEKVVTTNEDGSRTIEDRKELLGFDATNPDGKSIKDSDFWKILVALKDRKKAGEDIPNNIIDTALENVHNAIRQEYTNVRQPEVFIAPTMFSDFNIPKGTELEDISVLFFMGNDNISEEDAKIKLADFNKTLEIALIRIPSTSKQSYMSAKVVGFAHESGNTFYTNLDVLYLQGADQDIDKGNLLTYEVLKGKIIIPKDINEAKAEYERTGSTIPLKNFIVSQVINASKDKDTLIESTTPTTTDNLESLAKDKLVKEDEFIDDLNPFSASTMFTRGQAGMKNVGVHAAGLRAYSALYYAYKNKEDSTTFDYVPTSDILEGQSPELKGLSKPDSLEYMETMSGFSELINAATDNAKNPILGALHIDGITGGLVNTMTALGYSQKQIVDFLFSPTVLGIVEEFKKSTLFNPNDFNFKTLLSSAIESNIGGLEKVDLIYFLKIADEFNVVGKLTSITKEVPNTPYEHYKFFEVLNEGVTVTDDVGNINMKVTIQKFVSMTPDDRLNVIKNYDNIINDKSRANRKYINIYSIINNNPHLDSYLKSALQTSDTMREMSSIHGIISDTISELVLKTKKPLNEKSYKEMENFIYGLAVDDYLKTNKPTVTLTIDGNIRNYDLSLVKSTETTLGRIEFMRDFPEYFMSLDTNHQNSIKDYMTVEEVGKQGEEINILKMESDFLSQSTEQQLRIESAMSNMEESIDNDGKADLRIPKDNTATKELMFFYAIIKDKGGNSGTSITALFDDVDMQDFNNHLDNWNSNYLRIDTDSVFKLLGRWSTSFNKNTKALLKGKDTAKSSPRQYYNFIPYSGISNETVESASTYSGTPVGSVVVNDDLPGVWRTTFDYAKAVNNNNDYVTLTKDISFLRSSKITAKSTDKAKANHKYNKEIVNGLDNNYLTLPPVTIDGITYYKFVNKNLYPFLTDTGITITINDNQDVSILAQFNKKFPVIKLEGKLSNHNLNIPLLTANHGYLQHPSFPNIYFDNNLTQDELVSIGIIEESGETPVTAESIVTERPAKSRISNLRSVNTIFKNGEVTKKALNSDVITLTDAFTEDHIKLLEDAGFHITSDYKGRAAAISPNSTLHDSYVELITAEEILQDYSQKPISNDDAPFQKVNNNRAFDNRVKKNIYSKPVTDKTMNGIVNIINSNGGNVEILTSKQISERYSKDFAQHKGFVAPDGASIVNSDLYTLDTPIHEMGHIWIKTLKFANPKLYNELINEALSHPDALEISKKYPELKAKFNNNEYNNDALGEEIFATLFGLYNQDKALNKVNTKFANNWKNKLREFKMWLNSWFNANFGIDILTADKLSDIIDRAGDALLISSNFNFANTDFTLMRNVGINLNPEVDRLREVKRQMEAEGLLIKTC